jgi:putative transposase
VGDRYNVHLDAPGFTGALKENSIRISMDRKDCWRDNVFVERLWRSISSTRRCISRPTTQFPTLKPVSGNSSPFTTTGDRIKHFSGKTPDMVYFAGLAQEKLSA